MIVIIINIITRSATVTYEAAELRRPSYDRRRRSARPNRIQIQHNNGNDNYNGDNDVDNNKGNNGKPSSVTCN